MGAVVEIWFESLIPFLLKDSHIVHWVATGITGGMRGGVEVVGYCGEVLGSRRGELVWDDSPTTLQDRYF